MPCINLQQFIVQLFFSARAIFWGFDKSLLGWKKLAKFQYLTKVNRVNGASMKMGGLWLLKRVSSRCSYSRMCMVNRPEQPKRVLVVVRCSSLTQKQSKTIRFFSCWMFTERRWDQKSPIFSVVPWIPVVTCEAFSSGVQCPTDIQEIKV